MRLSFSKDKPPFGIAKRRFMFLASEMEEPYILITMLTAEAFAGREISEDKCSVGPINVRITRSWG